MKATAIIIAFFIFGLLLGRFDMSPSFLESDAVSEYALYALMFLVGISIGGDSGAMKALRTQSFKVIWVPMATIVGTMAGVAIIAPLVSGYSLTDCMTVGAGFGYYSLSTILINDYKGVELGTVALVANILREVITMVMAPLLVRWFSPLAPICAGGATTADVTLPVITRYSGADYAIIAIFHGVVVDFSVPFLVTLFASL